MKSVLFVCMANICRSPVLEATLRHLATQQGKAGNLYVDSCGIGWFHLGEHPDPRAFEAAKKRGILVDHRAQQFQEHFFDLFDHILTVDPVISEQLKLLRSMIRRMAVKITDFPAPVSPVRMFSPSPKEMVVLEMRTRFSILRDCNMGCCLEMGF